MKAASTADLQSQEVSLESLLHAAGAHTWTLEQIKAYAKRERKKAPPPSLLWHLRPLNSFLLFNGRKLTVGLLAASGLSAFSLLIAYSLWGTNVLDTPVAHTIRFGSFACASAGIACCLLDSLAWRLWRIKVRPPAEWIGVELKDYDGIVPQKARDIIDTVTALKPGTQVVIYELRQDEEVLDPILQIDEHFVLVWDADGAIIEPH